MTRRSAFSLLELLVVLCIISTLLALFFPAVQRARASAGRLACANNLRQIGLSVKLYTDAVGVFPYARECPAPWRNGKDLPCETLPSPAFHTGPNEVWWAPYDNRPRALPTRALPDYKPRGTLLGYLENPRMFLCSEAVDTTTGSPTFSEPFQVGYAFEPRLGGKRENDRRVPGVIAWDHMDLPSCQWSGPHWLSWSPTDPGTPNQRHLARRHLGLANVLHHEGHVRTVQE